MLPIAAISGAVASIDSGDFVNFIRQRQQESGVEWDMPVAAAGSAISALALERGASLFQLWTLNGAGKEHLLDQKLVAANLPTASVKIITADPHGTRPRTRVDQGFTVDIRLEGAASPPPATATTRVVLEQHLQNYPTGSYSLDAATVMSNTPFATAGLSSNGMTRLNYAASSLQAKDPTRASGEEYFVIHAVADGRVAQTQIAAASVQVWPVASGTIAGLTQGKEYRYRMPPVQLHLTDLYPRSDTWFMVYEGTAATGTGTIIRAFPMDRDTIQSLSTSVSGLESKITKDGTHTVALVSQTVFGSELLCPPLAFSFVRTITAEAPPVNSTAGQP